MVIKKEELAELELILAGSPDELKANIPLLLAIVQIVKFYTKQNQQQIQKSYISPEFADYIQLTIHWKGITEGTLKNHTVEKSIRLKKINPKTVTLITLQDIGKRVISKFNKLTFKTGHVKCKYTKWKDGIQTYGYFQNENIGYQVVEALGDIGDFKIDKDKFRYENVLDPKKAYKQKPNKIQVAGNSVRPPATAPIATMSFSHASLTFPWISHTETLCTSSSIVITNLNFLSAYQE